MKAILSSKLMKLIEWTMWFIGVILRSGSNHRKVRLPIISFTCGTSTTVVTAEQLVAAIRKYDSSAVTMVKKMGKQEMDRKDKVRNYRALVH